MDSALSPAFSVGSPTSGHYSFDPEEPDFIPEETWIGACDYGGYAFDIAGYVATVGLGRILVVDEGESTVDIYRVQNVRTEPDPVTGTPGNEAAGPFFDVRGTLTSLEVESAAAVPSIGSRGRWGLGLLMATVGYGLLHHSVWGRRRPPAHT